MKESEKRPTGLLTDATELRKLLLENPELPLLVFAGENCNSGDYCYMSCGVCNASIGEYLDCCQEVNEERCYTDRDDFEEDLGEQVYDRPEAVNKTDEELEAIIKVEMAEYEPFWKPCIILYADN